MAAQPQILNPGEYDEEQLEIVSDSLLSAYEEAERSSQVSIAKKYPRSLTAFRKELSEIARMNQPVAMEMMYSVPRAGKQLIGPSVRFAEAVLSSWGNCHAAVRIKDVAGDFIIAESAFYDAEKNARLTVEVKRRITDKNGKRFNADMIGVTGAAASSIALRGAILRGVPKALWNDLFEQARKTAAGDVASMEATRNELVALFRALGITDPMLFNALGVQGMADVGTDELVAMKAWHKQIINKDCTLEDIFGSTDDAEIEQTMEALGWNEAKKTMSRANYKGDRSGLLEYLRDQLKAAKEATGGKPVAIAPRTSPAPAKTAMSTADRARMQLGKPLSTDPATPEPQQTAAVAAEKTQTDKPAAKPDISKDPW